MQETEKSSRRESRLMISSSINASDWGGLTGIGLSHSFLLTACLRWWPTEYLKTWTCLSRYRLSFKSSLKTVESSTRLKLEAFMRVRTSEIMCASRSLCPQILQMSRSTLLVQEKASTNLISKLLYGGSRSSRATKSTSSQQWPTWLPPNLTKLGRSHPSRWNSTFPCSLAQVCE